MYEIKDGVKCTGESVSWRAFKSSDISAETLGIVAGVNNEVPIKGTHMSFNLHLRVSR